MNYPTAGRSNGCWAPKTPNRPYLPERSRRLEAPAKCRNDVVEPTTEACVFYTQCSSGSARLCGCARPCWPGERYIGRKNFFICIGGGWQISGIDQADRLGKLRAAL